MINFVREEALSQRHSHRNYRVVRRVIMARVLSLIPAVFLFGSVVFLCKTVASHNVYPNVLETTIITENDEEVSMRWVETESFLVNENSPVWTTTSDYRLIEDREIMNRIGKMRMYYDLGKSSAIILVEKWDCIFGIIDVRYTIVCLPLDQLFRHQHKIGENLYIMKIDNNEMIHHENSPNIWRPFESDRGTSSSVGTLNDFRMLVKTWTKPQISPVCHVAHSGTENRENFPSTSSGVSLAEEFRSYDDYEDQVIITYPEIFILVPYDVASFPHHLDTLVLQYIVQFNAVAMLFAKLATHNIKIHINMAGMIIDRGYLFFPPGELFARDPPEGEFVLRTIMDYMNRLKNPREGRRQLFFDDSFDMFIYSTTKDWLEKVFDPRGLSTRVFDLLSIRNIHTRVKERKFLGSIVNYPNMLQHYVNIAREIAHLMTVRDDKNDVATCGNGENCRGIMQKDGQYCPHCLTWSSQSVHSFKRFLSVNTNRCFLRNFPRSLYPIDQPVKTFIPADQCLCYGYTPSSEATHLERQFSNVCKRFLRCLPNFKMAQNDHHIHPIDGTPCDKNDDTKVCWKRYCISTQSTIRN